MDSVRDGQLSVWKIWKRRFFQDIPISFRSLEAIKVLAKMGHGGPADWAMAKIFFVNLAKALDEQLLKISAQ